MVRSQGSGELQSDMYAVIGCTHRVRSLGVARLLAKSDHPPRKFSDLEWAVG